jgi:hypothetical protein
MFAWFDIGHAGGVMTPRTLYGQGLLLILAAGLSAGLALRANAQSVPVDEPVGPAAEINTEANDTETGDGELDWSQLNVDASTLTSRPGTLLRSARAAANGETSWSSNAKPNGSAALTVKQPLSPFWDARIGADMTVVNQPQTLTGADLLRQKFSSDSQPQQSSGTAWAALTAPGVGSIWDKTAIEARIDPSQEQSKLGTSLSKSLPLGGPYSLTLQNGYNLIQQGIVPVPGIVAHPARNYEVDRSAKLTIADTGTSLIAGQSLSSTDDKWLNKIGAEQKLFGGVSITGTIGETPLGISNKSLTAGFKHSW